MTTDTDMDGAWPLPTGRVELLGPEPEEARPVAWLRDQRGEYEGPETLDPFFVLGASKPRNFTHGATYSPLYAAPPARPVAPAGWNLHGIDLYGMAEAFARVIEAHADKHSPFHQPVNADAMTALRVLRGIIPMLAASPAAPAPVALSQRAVDDLINASREADEGPTELVRRVERAIAFTGTAAPVALSEEQIDVYFGQATHWNDYTPREIFNAGVRFAEQRHGIKE